MPRTSFSARSVPAALCALTLAAAGCSSSTSGTGSPAGGTAHPGATATSAGTSAATTPAHNAAELGARMLAAVQQLHSVHLTLSGNAENGQGDSTMSDGRTTASDLTVSAAGRQIEVRVIGKRSWVKLPGMQRNGKPWTLVSTTSSDPTIRAMATTMQSTQSMTSLTSFLMLVKATTKFAVKGADTVDGTPATHYALTVDLTKANLPGAIGQAVQQAHVTAVPVDLWTDSRNRPVRVSETITVGGQTVSIDVRMSEFDKPVTIAPPPAGQVSTG